MNRLFCFLMSIVFALCANAQDEGTVFVEKPFPEVLAQAKQEGKMVMIDCYATYCPQCVRMVREVFPKKEVGEYINSRFVCAKYNLDKEAKEYSKGWDVQSFPAFLFMNADGEVQFRIYGYRPSERFLQMVDSAYNNHKAIMVEKQYQNGDRSRETVIEYLKMTKAQRRGNAYTDAAKEYLNANADNLLRYEDDYSLFEEVIVSPYDAAFLHVQDNKTAFVEKYGNKVYAYDTKTGDETALTFAGVPASENISYISCNYPGSTKKMYLILGTQNGQNYTLRFYPMLGGKPDGEPIYTVSGTGTVKSVRYTALGIDNPSDQD